MNGLGNEKPVGAKPGFPFGIDRRMAGSVERQFTDALRSAIVTGRYKPGEVLPSIVEFSRGLGVSIRAPQAALKTLAKEGLVCPRRRTGTVVAGARDAAFRGSVLFVDSNRHPIYYDSLIEARALDALSAAGYFVSRVATPAKRRKSGDDWQTGSYDLRQLRLALRQSVSCAVLFGSRLRIVEAVVKAGIPFAVVGGGTRIEDPLCAAFASSGPENALQAVISRLRAKRPRRFVQVAIRETELLDRNALSAVCGEIENLVLWPKTRGEPLAEDFVRAGFAAVGELLSRRGERPDAYLFTDDYPARGALTALLAAGVRTGRDAHFMTIANRGILPVHPDPVDMLLHDPASDSAVVAEALLGFLEHGARRGAIALPIRLVRDFVAGTGA